MSRRFQAKKVTGGWVVIDNTKFLNVDEFIVSYHDRWLEARAFAKHLNKEAAQFADQ